MKKKVKQKALPTGWREVRLGEVGSIHSGGTPSTRDDSNWDGDIPWLTPSEVTKLSRKDISATERKITPKGLSSTTLLPPNCLIVCTRATIGHCCINVVPMAINQGFKCIQPHKDYSVTFLYYVFQLLKQRLVRLSCGNTFGEVSKKDFESILITLPPLPEQKTIASLLEKWDTAIEKTEALIAAKEKQFKWLLKTLISDQQDNPEWRKVKLGEIASLYQPKTIPKKDMLRNGQYKVFGANGVIGSYHKYNHEEAEIAVVCRGATCGIVNMTEPKSWITGNAMVVKPDEGCVNKSYLYNFLSGASLTACISGAAQPQITRQDLFHFQTIIPTISEQKQIATTLETAEREIGLRKRLTEQYRRQKRGLMQKLLTGEWRFIQSFPRKQE